MSSKNRKRRGVAGILSCRTQHPYCFLPRLCRFTYCQSRLVISEGEILSPSLPLNTVASFSSSWIPYPPKDPLLFVEIFTSRNQRTQRRMS